MVNPIPKILNTPNITHDRSSAEVADIYARLDRLPATSTIWKLIVLISLGYFFEFYELFYSAYIAPGLIQEGLLTATTPGLFGGSGVASFVAALFAGLFVGTALCGVLADRFGRRSIFTWSLLWYVIASTVMAFQSSTSGVNFWRFIAGIGLGTELVTIASYLTELAPRSVRGRAFALGQTLGFLASPVAAWMAWLLVPQAPLGWAGWRWVVLAGSASALPLWWIRRAVPESPRWLARRGRIREAVQILTTLEDQVRREYGKPLPDPVAFIDTAGQCRFADLWRPPYLSRTLLMIVFNIFQTIGFYGFASWVPTLMRQQGISLTGSLWYAFVIALAAPFGPLLAMQFADRIERTSIIIASALMMLVSGLLFSQASSVVMLLATGIAMTLSSNVLSCSYHAYQAELFPTIIRGHAVGFVYSWGRLAAVLNAYMIALVMRHAGVPGVFALIAAAMLVIVVAIYCFGPRTKGLTVDSI